MNPNATPRPWRAALARSAVFRAAGLSSAGFIGWLWFSSADDPAWYAVSLVAVLALAALVGFASDLRRARTEGRWRAALDLYAEQQLAVRAIADRHDARDPDVRLEDFAAKLTSVASPVVLRRRPKGSWLEVELGLWHVLTETVKKWSRQRAAAVSQGVPEPWQEGLLTELTERAFSVAVEYGAGGPLPQLKSGLYLAFRSVIVP